MSTAIKICHNSEDPLKSSSVQTSYRAGSSREVFSIDIYLKMVENQRSAFFTNLDDKIENSRKNFILWLFQIAPRLEVSRTTLYNTISLLDDLIFRMKTDELSNSKTFQLMAVVCFFISFKFFECKNINLSFVEGSLLHRKWSQDEIRNAEIFILQKLDYQIASINTFSFYQFFSLIIKGYFKVDKQKQIDFIVNWVLQKAVILKEFTSFLTPLEQNIIVLNTTFLVLQQLTDFQIEEYSLFFMKLTQITANKQIADFEKYSSLLISNLTFSQDFLEKFINILANKGL